jgi:hypothetical protein
LGSGENLSGFLKKKAKKQEVGTEKKSGFGSQNGDLQGEKRDAEPLLWI